MEWHKKNDANFQQALSNLQVYIDIIARSSKAPLRSSIQFFSSCVSSLDCSFLWLIGGVSTLAKAGGGELVSGLLSESLSELSDLLLLLVASSSAFGSSKYSEGSLKVIGGCFFFFFLAALSGVRQDGRENGLIPLRFLDAEDSIANTFRILSVYSPFSWRCLKC